MVPIESLGTRLIPALFWDIPEIHKSHRCDFIHNFWCYLAVTVLLYTTISQQLHGWFWAILLSQKQYNSHIEDSTTTSVMYHSTNKIFSGCVSNYTSAYAYTAWFSDLISGQVDFALAACVELGSVFYPPIRVVSAHGPDRKN